METKTSDGAVVVRLSGEIVARAEQYAVSDLITEKLGDGHEVFVLDLTDVPYISSLGIACLVAAYVKVNAQGGKLKLVNPSPRVLQVLEMTKVADVFAIHTSVEDALKEA